MLNFIQSNNITQEDWMEDVLREKFSHDAWNDYDRMNAEYQLSESGNYLEALAKIGEITVDIEKIPDLNDPNTTDEEADKLMTPTIIAEKPIVLEIALGRPDLTEEDKECYIKIRKKLMQSVAKVGSLLSKKDLEKLVELSDHMTHALYGFNNGDTILGALKKYEEQMKKILSK